MKRFAAHFVFLPGKGFLKQCVVELNAAAIVSAVYPLTEEIESVSWMPGVIILLPEVEEVNSGYAWINTFFQHDMEVLRNLPEKFKSNLSDYQFKAIRLYPFDFSIMKANEATLLELLG